MEDKQKYGQFMTTRYNYILQNMKVPSPIKNIIEPIAGLGDLLKFIDITKYNIECYDIKPQHNYIIQRDTLNNIPDYKDKWVLTNPPYLARNKCDDKTLFDKFDVNDLYKCFIITIITNKCIGGHIIIPLNFFSSVRSMDVDLRKKFIDVYNIEIINIFEETVFDDTTITVCSLQFQQKLYDSYETNIYIYPSKKHIKCSFSKENNYTIGFVNIPLQRCYKISRLIKDRPNTNILVKCIDDSYQNKIQLKFVRDDEIYFDETPNRSARCYCTLVINPPISVEKQKQLVHDFNIHFNIYRNKYNSLFLCNYRESKNNFARKRISFDFIYTLVGYFLTTDKKQLDKAFIPLVS